MADINFLEIGLNPFYVIKKRVPIDINLNDLSIKYLIKLILYQNKVKFLKF